MTAWPDAPSNDGVRHFVDPIEMTPRGAPAPAEPRAGATRPAEHFCLSTPMPANVREVAIPLVAAVVLLCHFLVKYGSWAALGAVVAASLVAVAIAAHAYRRIDLEVGQDGLYMLSPGRRRFVPWADVRGASASGDDSQWCVHIRLAHNESVTLAMLRVPRASGMDHCREHAQALARRINEGRSAAAGREVEPTIDALERRGRSAEAWVGALRQLGAGGGLDHRAAALPAERLWRVVADPAAPGEARVGAAIALRASTLEDAERARIVDLAAATADAPVRAALEAVAAEEEAAVDALAEAVDELTERRRVAVERPD